jgi:hypothetical protein
VVHCEEYLHGKLHKLEFKITRVLLNYRIDFKVNADMRGTFLFVSFDDHTLFGADILFGIDRPLVGQLVDAILPHVFSRHIRDLKEYMAEEGRNLKKLIESELG